MKKSLFLYTFLFLAQYTHSQVPKKVVVEHFTNTKCSVCASLNPGFYSNLNAQSGVIHLSVHPSSPYAACVLSQHNPAENDARTKYYGVYGSTPRLVIQGVVVPNTTNYSSPAIFTPYLGQTTPVSIRIEQSKFGADSIRSQIIIKTEAAHSLPTLSLFVALAEDTIHYTGSNGEPEHYHVFRKSLTGATGVDITLPQVPGDSFVYTVFSVSNAAWNFSGMYTLAILQEKESKAVVQTQSVPASLNNNGSTGFQETDLLKSAIQIYSFQKTIYINQPYPSKILSIEMYDLSGRILESRELSTHTTEIDLSHLQPGICLYDIKWDGHRIKTGKVLLQ